MYQRRVIIDDIEMRQCILEYDELLRKHGIHPYYPYDHEEIVVHGGKVHRYTQPPRPRQRVLKD